MRVWWPPQRPVGTSGSHQLFPRRGPTAAWQPEQMPAEPRLSGRSRPGALRPEAARAAGSTWGSRGHEGCCTSLPCGFRGARGPGRGMGHIPQGRSPCAVPQATATGSQDGLLTRQTKQEPPDLPPRLGLRRAIMPPGRQTGPCHSRSPVTLTGHPGPAAPGTSTIPGPPFM